MVAATAHHNPKRKARVRKADWLNAALRVLRDSGVEAIRVERLAASLGVSKSGFYYHFRDRADLLDSLLEYWVDVDHAPAKQTQDMTSATPEAQLLAVLEAVREHELIEIDFAIQQWAKSDARVRMLYLSEMRAREDHIIGIFKQFGFTGEELKMRARTFVGYVLAEQHVFPEMDPDLRDRLWARRIRLLTTPSPE